MIKKKDVQKINNHLFQWWIIVFLASFKIVSIKNKLYF